MSDLNENEVVVPKVVEVQIDDSSSTSASNSSLNVSSESSCDALGSEEGEVNVEGETDTVVPLSVPSTSTPVTIAQGFIHHPSSIENLALLVVVPLNPPPNFINSIRRGYFDWSLYS